VGLNIVLSDHTNSPVHCTINFEMYEYKLYLGQERNKIYSNFMHVHDRLNLSG